MAVASKPPYSFRRAFGSKNGGLEATATVFRKLLGQLSIQLEINGLRRFSVENSK